MREPWNDAHALQRPARRRGADKEVVRRMRKHGEAGHVANTAPISGLQVNPKQRNGSHAMTKYAFVAASEATALSLDDCAIGVSVHCTCPHQYNAACFIAAAPGEHAEGDVYLSISSMMLRSAEESQLAAIRRTRI